MIGRRCFCYQPRSGHSEEQGNEIAKGLGVSGIQGINAVSGAAPA